MTSIDVFLLEALTEATRASRIVRLSYTKPVGADEETSPRRVEPYGVVVRKSHFYLVAWDLDGTDWRTFRMDRMRLHVPLGPAFHRRPLPEGDPASFVRARFSGGNTGASLACVGQVLLDVPAEESTTYLTDGEVLDVDDGLRVRLGASEWQRLLGRLLDLDVAFRIEGPDALFAAAASLERRLRRARRAT